MATVVADSGILGEPLDIEPDITRAEVARLAGTTIDALRQAGSRGKAVHGMLAGLQRLSLDLYRDGKLAGVAALGGAEGAVLAASAMTCLPIGVPKVIVTPIASGRRRFGPLVGTRDVMVVHSVIDILGINPISTRHLRQRRGGARGHGAARAAEMQVDRRPPRVAMTMLGNTTKGVMRMRDVLAERGLDSVIFHSNGVGGPAMEELAAQGLFAGVIDFTTDELTDDLVRGLPCRRPGPAPRDRAPRPAPGGRAGLHRFQRARPAGGSAGPLAGAAVYTHNPEFTLVRTLGSEMIELGRRFAERLNEARGPVAVMVPTEGLSIPNVPGGVFWDPEADAGFLTHAARAPARRHSTLYSPDAHQRPGVCGGGGATAT